MNFLNVLKILFNLKSFSKNLRHFFYACTMGSVLIWQSLFEALIKNSCINHLGCWFSSFIIFFYLHNIPCILIIYFHSTSSRVCCAFSLWLPFAWLRTLFHPEFLSFWSCPSSPLHPGLLLISPFFAYLAYLTACLFIYALISLAQPWPASIFSINRGFFHRVLWSPRSSSISALFVYETASAFFLEYRGVTHRSLHASAAEIRKIFAAKREINCTQMIARILCKTKWSLVPWKKYLRSQKYVDIFASLNNLLKILKYFRKNEKLKDKIEFIIYLTK